MAVDDGGFLTLSVAEARTLPEQEFRELFVRVVNELIDELAETFTHDVDFLGKDGERAPSSLSTREMREVILRHQYWFNPKTTKRRAANDRP